MEFQENTETLKPRYTDFEIRRWTRVKNAIEVIKAGLVWWQVWKTNYFVLTSEWEDNNERNVNLGNSLRHLNIKW